MLLRNTRQINQLWRLSSDAARVLSDPKYMVFDEWWGDARDHFPAILTREAAAGRIRLSISREASFLDHDLNLRDPFVVCWRNGRLSFY